MHIHIYIRIQMQLFSYKMLKTRKFFRFASFLLIFHLLSGNWAAQLIGIPFSLSSSSLRLSLSLCVLHMFCLVLKATASVARAFRFIIEALVHAVRIRTLSSLQLTNGHALLTVCNKGERMSIIRSE